MRETGRCERDDGAEGRQERKTHGDTLARECEKTLKGSFRRSRGAPASISSATSRRRPLRGQGEVAALESSQLLPARRHAHRARRSSPSGSRTSRSSSRGTEAEALHLEQNLVKRHRPPFNIRLRDDKSFPYIAVTLTDEYPRVMFTRERHRRGTLYFGPYANAKKVRETLDVLNRVFRFRPCEGPRPGRHSGIPCLDFHIDRCFAPCIGAISKEDYAVGDRRRRRTFSRATRRRSRPSCRERMREAAADERFEEAARYRNRLFSIRHLADRQAADRRDVGLGRRHRARDRRRPGRGAGLSAARRQDDRPLRVPPRERRRRGRAVDPRGVRARVLRRVAERAAGGADPGGMDDAAPLAEFLRERRGSRVVVRTPLRGEKRRLVELATENATARARGRRRRARGSAVASGSLRSRSSARC